MWGKGENAGNQHFLLFPQCFLTFPNQISIFNWLLFSQWLWYWLIKRAALVRIRPRPYISAMHLFISLFVTDFVRKILQILSIPTSLKCCILVKTLIAGWQMHSSNRYKVAKSFYHWFYTLVHVHISYTFKKVHLYPFLACFLSDFILILRKIEK